MTTLPDAAATYLARSHRAARAAKWVVFALIVSALIANAWFLWQSSQASAADSTSTAKVTIAQGRAVRADNEVTATKLTSDNALLELNSNLRFQVDSSTIQGLSMANATYVAAWEKAKINAATATEDVVTARVLAVVASSIAADSAQRTLVVGGISLVVVLVAGGIAFALSMSATRAAAMISIAPNGFLL